MLRGGGLDLSAAGVCAVGSGAVGATMGASVRRAFTLIELVIVLVILGIIAAIAVPRFSHAAVTAAETRLEADRQALLKAIGLYQSEHAGLTPAQWPDGSVDTDSDRFARRLLTRSNDTGAMDDDGLLGPYLDAIPMNPHTACRMVQIGNMGSVTDCAWRFEPGTLKLRPDHSAVDIADPKW